MLKKKSKTFRKLHYIIPIKKEIMPPKRKQPKGLSDPELIKKYEAGKIDLKKEIKKTLPTKTKNSK